MKQNYWVLIVYHPSNTWASATKSVEFHFSRIKRNRINPNINIKGGARTIL